MAKGLGGKRVGPSKGLARHPGKQLREKLSSNEIQHICNHLTKLHLPSLATSNYVQTGTTHLNHRIVDSDANTHMQDSSKGLPSDYPSAKHNHMAPECGGQSGIYGQNL
ncbi:hypothetical protein H5410_045425 [Solanum commersonii]|uniref:Uncharacterized protein n=1 Tax=Solanum commersonii TaxID=4109 RepID=A0A9J5XBK4_SOLCO|nr:hypothetical protein H5410_045425 [Solanum commersonii]